jgi:RNA polymerase sigma-70 factor (ECF subfamily)
MFEQTAIITEMDKLRRFALRLTRNASDAEDLLQSTVLRALEKNHMFETGTDLFKWSSKIMFNLFVTDYRRKTKFETQYDPESYLERESVEADQDMKLELSRVQEAMRLLSTDHREILVLVCVKGMQYQEVSEMLQIPVGTVRSRLSRAREQLQALMEAAPHNTGFIPPRHGLDQPLPRAA